MKAGLSRRSAAGTLLCLGLLLGVAGCSSEGPGLLSGELPVLTDGPALLVPQAQLAAALSCTPDLANATRDPVLITPAFSTAQESFSGYLAQLPALGIPTCSLTLPDRGFDDLQTAAEYVVHAVREMARISGRKVILFGHQHGPLDQLWALMFWPDLPAKVSSLISLATPYQGTVAATAVCETGRRCSPAVWQIRAGSEFLAALNARPLPAGLPVTAITTLFDEVIIPQPEAGRREGAANIVLQDICPGRMVEHFLILSDNLAYELVLDAFNHPGEVSSPGRLPADICSGPRSMPTPAGAQGSATPQLDGFLTQFPLNNVLEGVSAEPALRDYAQ